jgi:hypothetical protein
MFDQDPTSPGDPLSVTLPICLDSSSRKAEQLDLTYPGSGTAWEVVMQSRWSALNREDPRKLNT